MTQRLLLWGLASATFVVTLGITSWQSGLWASQDAPAAHESAAATPAVAASTPESTAVPAHPFAPTRTAVSPPTPAPKVAVARAEAPAEPAVPAQDTPQTADRQPDRKPLVLNPDEQEFHAHADRAAGRGARSH